MAVGIALTGSLHPDHRVKLSEAREWLAIGGFDPQYGARPLRRLVQSAIGDQLAKELLAGRIRDTLSLSTALRGSCWFRRSRCRTAR